MVLNAEGTGARADTRTHAQGRRDAKVAQKTAEALGRPKAPIMFSVDYDASPHDQVGINAYLRGVASVIGYARTGVYGSYYVTKRAADAKCARWLWATYAWSGGQVDERAHIYQYHNAVRVAGATVDLDRILPGGARAFGCCCHTASQSEEDDMPSAKEVVDELLTRDCIAVPWESKSNPTWRVGNALASMWRYAYQGWGDVVPSAPDDQDNPTWQGRNSLGYANVQLRAVARQQRAILAAVKGLPEADVDEDAIVAGVLDGLDPKAIAAAIPDDLAQQVVDALGARLGAKSEPTTLDPSMGQYNPEGKR